MDKEISEAQQIIKMHWGDEEKFYEFCNCWIKEVEAKYFSERLPQIQVQIVPMSIFSLLFHSRALARYEDGSPRNTISIGVDLLTKDQLEIHAVLLHELVHVWEKFYSPHTAPLTCHSQPLYTDNVLVGRQPYSANTKADGRHNKNTAS